MRSIYRFILVNGSVFQNKLKELACGHGCGTVIDIKIRTMTVVCPMIVVADAWALSSENGRESDMRAVRITDVPTSLFLEHCEFPQRPFNTRFLPASATPGKASGSDAGPCSRGPGIGSTLRSGDTGTSLYMRQVRKQSRRSQRHE